MTTKETVQSTLEGLRDTIGQHRDALDRMSPKEQEAMFRSDLEQVREAARMLEQL